jgi:predicted PurR-regulated permease PerM
MQTHARPTERTLWTVLGLAVLGWLAWMLRQPLLLLFTAVLVATALDQLAGPLRRHGLGRRTSVFIVIAALALLGGVGLWQLGEPLSEQLQGLRRTLPEAWRKLHDWMQGNLVGRQALAWLNGTRDMELPLAGIFGAASQLVGTLASLALVVLAGIYLALDRELYRNGLLRLVPAAQRERARAALDETGHALSRWLLGQLVLMVAIGMAVTVGLWALGLPLALALGVIAGLFEFVPFFGPIAAGLLAMLVAFAQGPDQALYVALLFIGVQQLEGSVLVPLVQRWAVSLPPVLGLSAVVMFGTLFGLLGVLVGTPLMVVLMVWVNTLNADADRPRRAPHDTV